MRVAFLLGIKDCLVRFQSKSVLMFVVVFPLAATLVFGLLFQGMEAGKIEARVAVVVEDEAPSAEVMRAVEQLDAWPERLKQPMPEGVPPSTIEIGATVKIVEGLTEEEARRQVEEGQLHGALVLPAGFSDSLAAGEESQVELIVEANETMERSVVEGAADWFKQVLRQREARPVTIEPSFVGEAQRLANFDSMSQSVTGNGVLFILMNCMASGGVALVRERRQNTLARLLISPMKPWQIVLGKTIGVYLIGLAQAVIVFGFGWFWGVFEGVDMLGVTLVTMLLILVGCALGLVMSALARREETVEALSSPVALVISALGGALFPVELSPPLLKTISKLLPTGWAMDAYHALVWDARGTLEILPHLAVLAGFAVVLLGIGVWRLRFD
jgi:ABC-2 type transport system permease protein